MADAAEIRIGISACLLGEEVGYNGGHKKDAFLTEVLAPHVVWLAVCPEVEARDGDAARNAAAGPPERRSRTGPPGDDPVSDDYTDAMRPGPGACRSPGEEDLDGYVLKKDSPSCGMERVKVYPDDGGPEFATGVACSPRR